MYNGQLLYIYDLYMYIYMGGLRSMATSMGTVRHCRPKFNVIAHLGSAADGIGVRYC